MPTTFLTTDSTTNTTIGSSYNIILLQGVTATSTTSVFEYTGAADLSIYGHVFGGSYGITESTTAVTMTMNVGYSGSLYGVSAGIYITQFGATVRVMNDGHISAEGRAMLMQANDIAITNNGTISSISYSGTMAFYSDDNENGTFSLNNTGLISNGYATSVTAIYIQNYASAIVRNSGTISAHGTALFFSSTVDARVENSGSLEGAIETSTTSVVDFSLINSGFIGINDEGYSLYMWAADNFIRNTGEIQGNVGFFNLSEAIIVNGGTIGGDLTLNGFVDSYRAVGDGVTMGTVFGNGGNDTLIGGNLNDDFDGGTGADSLRGGGGDDVLYGEAGDDRVLGGDGNDVIRGDADNDFLHGGNGDDTLRGGTGDDTLNGGNGDDYMLAEEDNDQVRGGYGNDEIDGGDGADTIYGDAGDDTITGGLGRDIMSGGDGLDTFVFTDAAESAAGAATRDTIMDFAQGQDLIDLTAAVPGILSFIGTDAFTGTANEVRLVEVTASGFTRVLIDTNADGTEDMEMVVRGVIGLTADDFDL